MTFADGWQKVQNVLEFRIIELDSFSFAVYHIFIIAGVIGFTKFSLWALKKVINQEGIKEKVGEGRQHALFQIVGGKLYEVCA